jgi:hypothetical protein
VPAVVDAGVEVGDWLCAASSSLIVAGEICEAAPNPVAGIGFVEAGAGLPTSNGLSEPWSRPVDDEVESD